MYSFFLVYIVLLDTATAVAVIFKSLNEISWLAQGNEVDVLACAAGKLTGDMRLNRAIRTRQNVRTDSIDSVDLTGPMTSLLALGMGCRELEHPKIRLGPFGEGCGRDSFSVAAAHSHAVGLSRVTTEAPEPTTDECPGL
jgi:hypothetical protein